MDESEYKKRLEIIERNFEMEKKKLMYEYGMSKVIFKIGDIIKDERWALLIDKITVAKPFGFSMPEPVYNGPELKKDLTPRKDNSRVSIYGNHATLVLSAGEKI
jgi:hypothetical protein